MRSTKLFFLLTSILTVFLISSCGASKKSTGTNQPNKVSTSPSVKPKSKANLVAYYAELLQTKEKDLNDDLYQYIDEWMGIPHRLGGQTKNGIDCSGFVGNIYHTVYGKTLPRTSRDMAEVVKRKYSDQLKEGDLVFFSFGGGRVDHVGIYLWNDKFIHVSTKQGVVISNLKDPWYSKYLVRAGTPQV